MIYSIVELHLMIRKFLMSHTPLSITTLCILSLLGNLLLVILVFDALKLPLFGDTVFTVALVFYEGLFPALIVAFLYNIIRALYLSCISSSLNVEFLYNLCGIAIVFITWLFARKKSNFHISFSITILYLLLISLLTAFASSLIGGIVDIFYYIQGKVLLAPSPVNLFVMSFLGQNLGMFISGVFGRLPVTVLDRLICTFVGYSLYRYGSR